MDASVITSFASDRRISCSMDWLKARSLAEKLLIVGATPNAANELARSLSQDEVRVLWLSPVDIRTTGLGAGTTSIDRTTGHPTRGTRCSSSREPRNSQIVGGWQAWPICQTCGRTRICLRDCKRHHGIKVRGNTQPDALMHVAPDLVPLLQEYEQELAKHAFVDWPGVLHTAAATATDPRRKHQSWSRGTAACPRVVRCDRQARSPSTYRCQ